MTSGPDDPHRQVGRVDQVAPDGVEQFSVQAGIRGL